MTFSHRLYFDFNATSPLRREARESMLQVLERVGNPSSIHAEGREARAQVEQARAQIATLVGAHPKQVIFTSGGTESANLILNPHLWKKEKVPTLLILNEGEHACVLKGHGFLPDQVEILPLTNQGVVEEEEVSACLERYKNHVPLLALQAANNETGVLQPLERLAALIHQRGGWVICDSVQRGGRLPLSMKALEVDALFISSHKMGGPLGAGALILREDLHVPLLPLIRGGGQERGWRGGTENVAALVGFGRAADVCRQEMETESQRLAFLRDRLEDFLKKHIPDVIIFGAQVPRLPNTCAFAIPGLSSETFLMSLDLNGIAASSGAACSSGKVQMSRTLMAMGISSSIAKASIRLSLGYIHTQTMVDELCLRLSDVVKGLRHRRPLS